MYKHMRKAIVILIFCAFQLSSNASLPNPFDIVFCSDEMQNSSLGAVTPKSAIQNSIKDTNGVISDFTYSKVYIGRDERGIIIGNKDKEGYIDIALNPDAQVYAEKIEVSATRYGSSVTSTISVNDSEAQTIDGTYLTYYTFEFPVDSSKQLTSIKISTTCYAYVNKITVYYKASTSDITSIEITPENDNQVQYFNLHGIQVNPENLSSGIYIRKTNTKTEKIVINND